MDYFGFKNSFKEIIFRELLPKIQLVKPIVVFSTRMLIYRYFYSILIQDERKVIIMHGIGGMVYVKVL